MLKMRLALFGALALLIVSGIAASTASAAGPYWKVGGNRLGQSAVKQMTLQNKGNAVLKSSLGEEPITIECANSESEGAAIEGQGQFQGQAKGAIKYTGCTIPNANLKQCKVIEPIKTSQTKAHLVTYKGQTKYAILFEPQQGTTFTTINITKNTFGACLPAGLYNVTGKVAAELIPVEKEGQEGLMNFPETPIPTVFLENQEKTGIGLLLGTKEAKFIAAYKAVLSPSEKFGVFGV